MESQLNDGALKPGAAEITSLTGPPLSFHIPASTPRPRPRAPGKHPRGAHPGVRPRWALLTQAIRTGLHSLLGRVSHPPRRPRVPACAPPLSPGTYPPPPDARTRTHPAAAAVPRLAHVLGYLVALVEAHGHRVTRVVQSPGCWSSMAPHSRTQSSMHFNQCLMSCIYHYHIIQNSLPALKISYAPLIHPSIPQATGNH